MEYVPPSRRKIQKKEIAIESPTLVCKWCHESGHLSITCKYKGSMQEKKPDLGNVESFPSLTDSESVVTDSSPWKSNFNIDNFKDQISKITNNELKRIGSSAVSLDSMMSSQAELGVDEVDSLIYHNDHRLPDHHPYRYYYNDSILKLNDLYTPDFNKWWYVYLDVIKQ